MNFRLGGLIACLCVSGSLMLCAQGRNGGVIQPKSQSGVQVERIAALRESAQNYVTITDKILNDLEKAKNSHSDENTYLSPLHCAILAVKAWNIFRAEDVLLNMVNYRIDPRSVPDGMCLSGSAFYPAADALVGMRVDYDKVIHAISAASSKEQQLVLAWILVERIGDLVTAQIILSQAGKRFHGVSERKNIQAAIKILESSTDLLGDAMRLTNCAKK